MKGKSVAGWSLLMGAISAGVTFIDTDGDMRLVLIAFVVSAIVTAILGPSLMLFFKGKGTDGDVWF